MGFPLMVLRASERPCPVAINELVGMVEVPLVQMEFAMARLDTIEAEKAFPRVFVELRRAGWTPARVVELAPVEDAPGFTVHQYGDDFLRTFGGLQVRRSIRFGTAEAVVGFNCGFGSPLAAMNRARGSYYINKLVGDAFVFPVMYSGDIVGFLLSDGRLLAVDQTWRSCTWCPTVFGWMHFLLFLERTPGFQTRPLRADERPPEYGWE